jgi:hypothetical protein
MSPEPRVTVTEPIVEDYDSPGALAQAFGSALVMPTWWPADAEEVDYHLDRFPNHLSYRIDSLRHRRAPLIIVGDPEIAGAGRATGTWCAPPELASLRGLIGTTGIPPHLQAVVHDAGLAIHLLGYATQAEIIKATSSLRRFEPDPPS